MKSFQEFLEEAVRVEDSHYESANGTKPKGEGSWMFSKHKNHDVKTHPKEDLFTHKGKYSEAKAAAKKHFGEKGHIGAIYTQT